MDQFYDMRNKVYRKVDELEQDNKIATKEVTHLENYIRRLGETINGTTSVLNHYDEVKYYYLVNDKGIKNYVEKHIQIEPKINNWQKVRDEMYYDLTQTKASTESNDHSETKTEVAGKVSFEIRSKSIPLPSTHSDVYKTPSTKNIKPKRKGSLNDWSEKYHQIKHKEHEQGIENEKKK